MFSRIVGHHPLRDCETIDFPMWKTTGNRKYYRGGRTPLTGPLKQPGPGNRPDLASAATTVNLGYTSFPWGESRKTDTAQAGRTTKPLDPLVVAVLGFLRTVVLLGVVIEKMYESSLTGVVHVTYREQLARERVIRRSVAEPSSIKEAVDLIFLL